MNWLPGASLETIASGGTSTTSYGRGLIVAAVYLIAVVAATAITFTRSDITA